MPTVPPRKAAVNLKLIQSVVLGASLAGCAIHQDVRPVGSLPARQICVIENPAVAQAEFVQAYMRALQQKGFEVREISPGSPRDACPVTTTYTAQWRWHWALVMYRAELRIYSNGQNAGEAIYTAGREAPGQYIHAEDKIRELVDQLFPGGAR